jgi:hypothetical protein
MSTKDEYLKAFNKSERRVDFTNWLGEKIQGLVIVSNDGSDKTVTVKDLNRLDDLYHGIPIEDVTFLN